ncbi:unnamed protein product [Eruca vesicaria subsp. sativa]|uniref:Uncharacterized protein n=1 Tax=Eruca vesicaria subsp. sativa TaxID=29727 RepID=A0ABC8L9F1_ERUVS|nr:unnamed protein product [Eruca vesicaria subsp. sativa]
MRGKGSCSRHQSSHKETSSKSYPEEQARSSPGRGNERNPLRKLPQESREEEEFARNDLKIGRTISNTELCPHTRLLMIQHWHLWLLQRGISENEDLQNLTDGEVAETETLQLEANRSHAISIQKEDTVEKGAGNGEVEKKKEPRKMLFKQTTMPVGTSRKKFVQAILSPRKHAQVKAGPCQGDDTKQATDKEPSNPKPIVPKTQSIFMDCTAYTFGGGKSWLFSGF